MKKYAVLLFLSVMFVSFPANADLYFPHIAGAGAWGTEVCIINTGSQQDLNGVLQAYSNSGQLVESISVALSPGGRLQLNVVDDFSNPGEIGYMIFSSDSENAVGYLKFFIAGKYRVAIPAASEVNTGDIYVSHIASDIDWTTGISILNTTSLPKDLTIEFDDGSVISRTLAAKEHQAFTIRQLFDGAMKPNIQSAVIRNGDGIVGLEIFGSTEASGNNFLSGILIKGDTTTEMYYPHIASDAVWGTGIVAYNASDTACNLDINPYRVDGASLPSQTIPLSPGEKYVGIVRQLNLPEGTAWLSIMASCEITGFELFSTLDGKLLAGYTGVDIAGAQGVFAKIEKNGQTGIAFVNVEDVPAEVSLTAYDDDGNTIAVEDLDLNAHEKVVETAGNLFSGDIDNATYIAYSSSGKVVGFQLNASSDGMMLDALPGLFPKDVNGNGGVSDISGEWEFTFTNISSSCGPESGWSSAVTIVQNESSLDTVGFKNTSSVVKGTITDNSVTIGPADFPEDGGITTSTFNLTITSETTMTGKESWTWRGSGISCQNGVGDISAVKTSP